MQLQEDDLSPYLDEFEKGVRDEVILVGDINLEEVQVRHKICRFLLQYTNVLNTVCRLFSNVGIIRTEHMTITC